MAGLSESPQRDLMSRRSVLPENIIPITDFTSDEQGRNVASSSGEHVRLAMPNQEVLLFARGLVRL